MVPQKRLFVLRTEHPMKVNGTRSPAATSSELHSVAEVGLAASKNRNRKFFEIFTKEAAGRSCVRLLIFSRGCQLCLRLTRRIMPFRATYSAPDATQEERK
jgi:hypothetical protein